MTIPYPNLTATAMRMFAKAAHARSGLSAGFAHRQGGETSVPVFNRYALRAGDVIAGEALIEENDTTIYLPANGRAIVAPSFDLIADVET